MTTCTICDYHYSDARSHCPTCGCCATPIPTIRISRENELPEYRLVAVAHGAVRTRQIFEKSFQTPHAYRMVD